MHVMIFFTLLQALGHPMIDQLHGIGIREGLPPFLLECVIFEESRGQAKAVSPVNKKYGSRDLGLCQLSSRYLVYFSNKFYGGKNFDVFNPIINATIAARYLAYLIKRFGSIELGLIAYNGGETNLANGIIYDESREYAKRVLNDFN
ncbi:MAG: lytic transglycosylase domain-containing protein [Candidatus Nanoarchaeia archaeon]|nr:lytic transglycosylase domain-containing protein [Candidatus Nanoarchaeia archaeon]